jgi:phosphopantothenoylcysteine decarboxylase/phosphopantothenate--cysteine ligase
VRFVITAGPTREPIDPVRYLSNRSSGKMGYAIAEAAIQAGHEVILISGPVNLDPPDGAQLFSVSTSGEMYEAVHRHVGDCDVVVMCAAVADYKPAKVSQQKIKKLNQTFSLELIPTRDILASVAKERRQRSRREPSDVDGKAREGSRAGKRANQYLLVGFAAETNDVEKNAAKKLREKDCDIIVANDISGADFGMESDENEVTILFQNGEKRKISRAPKKIIAHELVKIFSNTREKRLTKKM